MEEEEMTFEEWVKYKLNRLEAQNWKIINLLKNEKDEEKDYI